MTNAINMSPAAIAINRFGLGATLNDPLPGDPKNYLFDQFGQFQVLPSPLAKLPRTSELMTEYSKNLLEMRNADQDEKKNTQRILRKDSRDDYVSAVRARAESALVTPTPFVERLVHFWSNHFAISVEKPAVANFAGAFEFEAIRPFVLGNFRDMLFAVETHPAMLIYLDQVRSIGPDSQAAIRAAARDPDKKHGLNENLAREIMELHTLGVRSGYTQTDVTEFARALTGWSLSGIGRDRNNESPASGFLFRPNLHEPGDRSIMGKTYSQNGRAQGEAILRDLSIAPATAKHIATKLARHFVSDTPSPGLVDRLTNAFLENDGELKSVYKALIHSPESWSPAPVKFKTPWEWLISALRGLGRQDLEGINIVQLLNQLGQPTWRPGSPAGFDDIADTWAAPNALLRRVEVAQRIAGPLGDKLDARTIGDKLLLGSISKETQTAISRSESASTGLALLLVSPEFLRR